jgi:hypothetical protein
MTTRRNEILPKRTVPVRWRDSAWTLPVSGRGPRANGNGRGLRDSLFAFFAAAGSASQEQMSGILRASSLFAREAPAAELVQPFDARSSTCRRRSWNPLGRLAVGRATAPNLPTHRANRLP